MQSKEKKVMSQTETRVLAGGRIIREPLDSDEEIEIGRLPLKSGFEHLFLRASPAVEPQRLRASPAVEPQRTEARTFGFN